MFHVPVPPSISLNLWRRRILLTVEWLTIALYAANASRWALHGSWPATLYWTGALIITLAMTFGYER